MRLLRISIVAALALLTSAVVAAPHIDPNKHKDLLSHSNQTTWWTMNSTNPRVPNWHDVRKNPPATQDMMAPFRPPLDQLPHWTPPDFTYRHNASQSPTTRRFTLRFHEVQGAPDGYLRTHYAINGHMPGEAIHVNENDEVEVTVVNDIDHTTTLHHHGLDMIATPWSDGVPGVSSCPIPPGSSYTYKFQVFEQTGTFFAHSHSQIQYTDGLLMPFISHGRNEAWQRGRDYDEELIIFLQDWYHDHGENISMALHGPGGYNNSLAAPPPQSILINGRGVYNCSLLPNPPNPNAPCSTSDYPEAILEPNTRYRLRLIQGGTHMQLRVSVDERIQRLIEMDATPVIGANVTHVRLHNAQRASTIINTSETDCGEVLWLRAVLQEQCLGYQDPTANNVGLMRLRIKGLDGCVPQGDPTSVAWPDDGPAECIDQDESELVPFNASAIQLEPVTNVSHVAMFSNQFAVFNASGAPANFTDPAAFGQFRVNGISGRLEPYQPLLQLFQAGEPIPMDNYALAVYPDEAVNGHLILNNLDAGLEHPYHLHTEAFTIVGRGSGMLTFEQWQNLSSSGGFNYTGREVVRDTMVIPGASWAVLHLPLQTGTWAIHCHINFHIQGGFFGVFAKGPGEMRNLSIPEENFQICRDGLAREGQSLDTIELPRRRRRALASASSSTATHQLVA